MGTYIWFFVFAYARHRRDDFFRTLDLNLFKQTRRRPDAKNSLYYLLRFYSSFGNKAVALILKGGVFFLWETFFSNIADRRAG